MGKKKSPILTYRKITLHMSHEEQVHPYQEFSHSLLKSTYYAHKNDGEDRKNHDNISQ